MSYVHAVESKQSLNTEHWVNIHPLFFQQVLDKSSLQIQNE